MTPDIQLAEDIKITQPSRTFAIDFQNGRIKKTTDELDAVVQAAIIAIQTERNNYSIFSSDYGSELKTLIGKDKDYVFIEAKRMIKEALYNDVRITAVRDFNMDGNIISFTIDTVFGTENLDTEVVT